MKLKQIPKEELELMGYDDIALLVLQESGKKMKLRDIFAKVINVLELPEERIDEELMDFFELMSINKKFVMLDKGYWDLQSRHKLDLVFDMEEDDEELENENAELREELEYYKNRKLSGRQKHNAKWMAIYNNFVDCYENGMTMIEIARRNNVSERTIYRYKAYYDKMRKVEVDE